MHTHSGRRKQRRSHGSAVGREFEATREVENRTRKALASQRKLDGG